MRFKEFRIRSGISKYLHYYTEPTRISLYVQLVFRLLDYYDQKKNHTAAITGRAVEQPFLSKVCCVAFINRWCPLNRSVFWNFSPLTYRWFLLQFSKKTWNNLRIKDWYCIHTWTWMLVCIYMYRRRSRTVSCIACTSKCRFIIGCTLKSNFLLLYYYEPFDQIDFYYSQKVYFLNRQLKHHDKHQIILNIINSKDEYNEISCFFKGLGVFDMIHRNFHMEWLFC